MQKPTHPSFSFQQAKNAFGFASSLHIAQWESGRPELTPTNFKVKTEVKVY